MFRGVGGALEPVSVVAGVGVVHFRFRMQI